MAAPRRPRGRFLLLVLVLLGVTLITLSDRTSSKQIFNKARSYAADIANPFQSGVHAALQPIGNFLYGAENYGALQREYKQLSQKFTAEQNKFIAAESTLEQADRVLSQEHLGYLNNIPSVAAEVIDMGSANFEQSVEINRGSSAGVAVGQPVVAAGGLLGSVTSVSAHLATVTLVDDPSFTVGVRVVRTGIVGAATGEGQGNPLQVENIDVGSPVKKGDALVTSGLQGERFPPGIPVGQVVSVSSPPGGLQLELSAKAYADVVNPQFVRVLFWSPQT